MLTFSLSEKKEQGIHTAAHFSTFQAEAASFFGPFQCGLQSDLETEITLVGLVDDFTLVGVRVVSPCCFS